MMPAISDVGSTMDLAAFLVFAATTVVVLASVWFGRTLERNHHECPACAQLTASCGEICGPCQREYHLDATRDEL